MTPVRAAWILGERREQKAVPALTKIARKAKDPFLVESAVEALGKIGGTTPAPIPLSVTGAGALIINLSCAFILARFRSHSGSLTRAAFLSARNDAVANVAIIAAGFLTAYTSSAWPDLIVGLGIFAINAGAAREVWTVARAEHREAQL
jgi:Co/Zn/Cd efflux system component